MSRVVAKSSAGTPKGTNPYDDILSALRHLTKHNSVHLTPSGDAAIFAALAILKKQGTKTLLIPDQGGWLSYKTFPPLLSMNIKEVKTDAALIDCADLAEKANNTTALLYTNPGGYIVDQPSEEIYSLCKKASCPVVMDVSGSLGTEYCDGMYADIIACSFNKWKIVNAGYGGFISTQKRQTLELGRDILRMLAVFPAAEEIILKKIKNLDKRKAVLGEQRKKVLLDLSTMDIVHRDHWGLNVIIRFGTKEEKETIIKYCKNNQLEYTECPRYIRINQNAISIEIKRSG